MALEVLIRVWSHLPKDDPVRTEEIAALLDCKRVFDTCKEVIKIIDALLHVLHVIFDEAVVAIIGSEIRQEIDFILVEPSKLPVHTIGWTILPQRALIHDRIVRVIHVHKLQYFEGDPLLVGGGLFKISGRVLALLGGIVWSFGSILVR